MLNTVSNFIKYMLLNYELLFILLITFIFILILVIVVYVVNNIFKYYRSKHILYDGTKNFNETVDYDAQFDKSKRYNYSDYNK